jgi:hypothetical protein
MSELAAIRADRRQRERQAVENELRANATPEALRHKAASVVDSMFAKGKLTAEQRRAANEIAEVWRAIAGGLFARVQEYEPRIRGGKVSDDWRAGMIRAYHDRYIPWRAEAGAQNAGAGRTVFDLVIAVAFDNYGFRQVGNAYGMDQRRLLRLVRESLYRYAEIAQWVDVKNSA